MITAVILAGGIASRMGNLCAETPKPMLRFGNEPFLAYLASWLLKNGCPEVIIVSGHLSEIIEAYFGTRRWRERGVRVVNDGAPRGTAYSAHSGICEASHSTIFQCNGDTLVEFDFARMRKAFRAQDLPAMTLLTLRCGVQNQGAVLAREGVVIDINEGQPAREPCANGTSLRGSSTGCYFLARAFAYANMAPDHSSFERQVLPGWAARRRLAAANIGSGCMVDFGTPERYGALLRDAHLIESVYGTPLAR